MTHGAFPTLLIIGANVIAIEKNRNGFRGTLGKLVLDQAAIDRNELVRPLAEKAALRLAVFVSDGKDPFVPIARNAVASNDLIGLYRLLPDTGQRAVDALELEAKLLFIAHMPGIASAALSKIRAGGIASGRGGNEQLFATGVDSCVGDFDDADTPGFALERPRNKNGAPFQATDAVCLAGIALDLGCMKLIFL